MMEKRDEQEFQRRYGQIVAKAWADPSFKARLLNDAKTVLSEHGITMPADVEVRIIEDQDKVVHLPLPRQPSGEELSEDQLANVAGGIVLVGGALNFGWSTLNLNAFRTSKF
jgi:hypothetical protein